MNLNIDETTYEEDLELLELVPRAAYMEVFDIIKEHMWEQCTIPSVGDIVDFLAGEPNEMFDDVTAFLDNEEKLRALLSKEDATYSNQESEVFIDKVMSSNVTDIRVSGYFYKKLMASTDDVSIIEDDCGSSGVTYSVEDVTREIYDFRIKFSYVTEIQQHAVMTYDDFVQKVSGFGSIHVRTPLSCNNAKHRRLCAKCCGTVKKAHDSFYIPKNFGIFSTLMITEHATQASLDSMNKGTSENVNNFLERKIGTRNMDWVEVEAEINSMIEEIGDVGVQARFYEVALISRIHEKEGGKYIASSFSHSINHQNDALGAYIFSPTDKNLTRLVNKEEFEANSIKSQMMFDVYERGWSSTPEQEES